MNNILKFSGHETFFCKQFWLKKGFDFIKNGKKFSDETAVTELGVGKNMVSAINHWSKSFGIISDDLQVTELGEYLFGERGNDKYLEDVGTLWLLHFHLVTIGKASIYNLFFNEFTRERIEFTKEQLHNFLKRKCFEISNNAYNKSTIDKDIRTFFRNYIKDSDKLEIEDDYSALLLELNLIETVNKNYFKLEPKEREHLPFQIVLFAILSKYNEKAISFEELFIGYNSPGKIFALNRENLFNKIEKICNNYEGFIFSQTAGNEVLQINQELNKWEVLNDYFN